MVGVHLERRRGGSQHLRVVGDAREQPARDALAPAALGHGHVGDLRVAARHDGTGIAHDLALVVSDPPDVTRLGKVVREELRAPGCVVARGEHLALERRHGRHVVHVHRAQLQVAVGQGIVAAGGRHRRGLLEAQAPGLVLLRVGEARVDGQHERGVTRLGGCRRVPGADMCGDQLGGKGAQQPLPRRVPGVLVGKAREAGRLELHPILLEPVAGKHDLVVVGTPSPRGDGRGHLGHRLDVEEPLGASLAHLVEGRVDLAAHGIPHHAHEPAHA